MYLKIMKENVVDIFKFYDIPYYVYISLTNICNANCTFCDVRSNKNKENVLDVKKVIDELSNLGTKYIHFTGGGEPFINDDILEYLEYCTFKNIKIVLISNGLNLDEEKIINLSKYNIVTIFFSIDSYKASIHNELRRTVGLWEKVTQNINLVKKHMPNVSVILNHVLNIKNIDDFQQFINMKNRFDFDYINPIVIKDCPKLFPTPEQIKKYNLNIANFYLTASKYGVKFFCDDINLFSDKVEENGSRDVNEDLKCVYPSYCAFIDCPTGNVYPCDCSIHRDRQLYNLGNLTENTFSEIWAGSKRKFLRDELLKGNLTCKMKCDEANCLFNNQYFKYQKELRR